MSLKELKRKELSRKLRELVVTRFRTFLPQSDSCFITRPHRINIVNRAVISLALIGTVAVLNSVNAFRDSFDFTANLIRSRVAKSEAVAYDPPQIIQTKTKSIPPNADIPKFFMRADFYSFFVRDPATLDPDKITIINEAEVYGTILLDTISRVSLGRDSIRDNYAEIGTAGGLVITNMGHFITACHVISRYMNSTGTVPIKYKGQTYQGTVLSSDRDHDVAFGVINPPLSDRAEVLVRFAELGEIFSDMPIELYGRQWDRYYFQKGFVTDTNKDNVLRNWGPIHEALVTDATGGPGYSGGPVFTEDGRVVGVTSFVSTETEETGRNTGVARIDHIVRLLDAYRTSFTQSSIIVGVTVKP